MSTEVLRNILAKYNIELDDAAAANLIAISCLPTSDIEELFNEIAIEKTFEPHDVDRRLF